MTRTNSAHFSFESDGTISNANLADFRSEFIRLMDLIPEFFSEMYRIFAVYSDRVCCYSKSVLQRDVLDQL